MKRSYGNKSGDKSGEHVAIIPIIKLFPPEFHPFGVSDDAAIERLVRSVKQYDVREPGLARPREDGGYELIVGNRRERACELSGLDTMPVIIRNLDDDAAAIAMAAHEVKPSLSQAQRLKKLGQSGDLTAEAINAILSEEKKLPKADKELRRWGRFFPADYTPSQIDKVITELLSVWQSRQHSI